MGVGYISNLTKLTYLRARLFAINLTLNMFYILKFK